MIENALISKIVGVKDICGWSAAPVEVEAVEESDDEIYVSCDIHDKEVEGYTLYSNLSAVIEKAKAFFGEALISYEVMENDEDATSRYSLRLDVSTKEAS